MPLIKKYLKLADSVFVGGALAHDFLKAEGCKIGKSLVGNNNYGIKELLKNKKLILPTDFVIKDEAIVDIGKETVKNLAPLIKKSKFILWNGPLGRYEDGGAEATLKVLRLVVNSKAESIIGGGDTVDLIDKMNMENKFSFVSTGGGAMLDFLANGTLPGIKALR
jgi:phosphoglycerate kinase